MLESDRYTPLVSVLDSFKIFSLLSTLHFFLFALTLSLTVLGQLAQHFFDDQNLTKNFPGKIWTKYPFMHDDVGNTFFFRQFFIL
jgi:hypothetical protein